MIFGVGIDIVKIDRIEKSYKKFGEEFAKRILTAAEMQRLTQTSKIYSFLAKHFAAKEAFVKALGTGFRQGVTLQQIQIEKSLHGQPQIVAFAAAKNFLDENAIKHIHLSLTDEVEYAAAVVVLEKVL